MIVAPALAGLLGCGSKGGDPGGAGTITCVEAPVAIATAESEPYGITVDDVSVYFTRSGAGEIARAPKAGGPIEIVVMNESAPQFAAGNATHVFWGTTGGGPGLRRFTKPSGPVETFAATPDARVVALDATQAYWTIYGNGAPVWRAPLAGGPAVMVAGAQPNGRGIAAFGTEVFWANQGTGGGSGSIEKADAMGGPQATVVAGLNAPGAVAVDGSGVYWGDDASAGGVFRVPLAGGAPEKLASGPVAFALAMDDEFVYFGAGSEVRAISKTGGKSCTLATGQNAMTMELDTDFVYWVNFGHAAMSDGSVMRARKACCR
jgi:hypothetical protein